MGDSGDVSDSILQWPKDSNLNGDGAYNYGRVQSKYQWSP